MCYLPSVCFISTERGGGGYMSIFRAARSVIEVTYCCVKDSEGGGMTKPGRSPPWRLNYRNI